MRCQNFIPPSAHASYNAVSITKPRPTKRQRVVVQCSGDIAHARALDCGRALAKLRAEEGFKPSPLLTDPFAACLVEHWEPPSPSPEATVFDLLAAKFIDNNVLRAVNAVNVGRGLEYNQVVLIGDGMCTRAFRLPWPSGTVIYLIAPGEVHERAEAILKANGARAQRGCLLRRIDCDLRSGGSCLEVLQRAGYRGDRLSIWALQGARSLDLSKDSLQALFVDMSNAAALESILLGELPGCSQAEAEALLASFGLLGVTLTPSEVAAEVIAAAEGDESALQACKRVAEEALKASEGGQGLVLFRAQQRRLSLEEMGSYEAHVAAAEEADEDFFGNFS